MGREKENFGSHCCCGWNFWPAACSAPAAGLADKKLLSMKEFCRYAGIGKTKARSYADENGLIVRIGRRVMVDRMKFDRLCDREG